MFSETRGVNPAYAIVAVFLILAWRNAGYLGLDSLALPKRGQLLHRRPRRPRQWQPREPRSHPRLPKASPAAEPAQESTRRRQGQPSQRPAAAAIVLAAT